MAPDEYYSCGVTELYKVFLLELFYFPIRTGSQNYILKIYGHVSLYLHSFFEAFLLFNFLISQFDYLKPSLANHVFTVASSQAKLYFVLSLGIINS